VKRPKQTRRYRRRTVRVHVEYDAPGGLQSATATTLGAGGMFVETEEPLDERTPIKVRFQLAPRGQLHEIEARVVWANRPDDAHTHTRGMGIEFKDRAACALLARELEGLDLADRR
jgi:Tfp pilus assembly protein PilZ